MKQDDQEAIRAFQLKVMDWWSKNARDLPWRKDPSPYKALVSEVMLQQTQVNRVVPKFLEFLQEFPTLEALATSDTRHLLSVWSGLGYNRRAIWLREAASQIIKIGRFPQEFDELRKLKGIGPYTSRSILIFAFNRDIAAVDTNIRRVMIAAGFASEEMTECQLQEVADNLLLRGRSRDWHNALMDYGSDVLTARVTGIAPTSRQPEFRGSSRQLRGAIIKELTQKEAISMEQLLSNLGFDCKRETVQSIIDKMMSERLIETTESGLYRIVK